MRSFSSPHPQIHTHSWRLKKNLDTILYYKEKRRPSLSEPCVLQAFRLPFSLQAYRVKSIEVAFQGGAPKDVHMTAGDYFDWTKHNGIVASLIAVSR